MPSSLLKSQIAAALLFAVGTAAAVSVTREVAQAPYRLYNEGFERLAQGNYDTVQKLPGASMAAIFASDDPGDPDQTFAADGPGANTEWESFLPSPPTPGDPLTLLAQGPTSAGAQNLAILDWSVYSPTPGASKSVYGLLDGTTFAGVPAPVSVGGAALAFLFELDQSIIGLDLWGVDSIGGGAVAGTLYASFFARDGSLVGSVSLALIPRTATSPGDDGKSLTFKSLGANFAGVVFTNDDNFGLNFDDLRYRAPLPGTGLLLLLGLAGLAGFRAGTLRPPLFPLP